MDILTPHQECRGGGKVPDWGHWASKPLSSSRRQRSQVMFSRPSGRLEVPQLHFFP